MAAITWDAIGERRYEIGASKGVLYKATEKDPYGLGVPWNGLTNVNESPEGAEITELYADNQLYAQFRSVEKYNATIEAYTYPDEFEECDGSASLTKGVIIGQQKRVPFGFCYRTEVGDDLNEAGDGDYKLHLVYGASASPTERTHSSINDSPDVETMSWEVNTTPVAVPGYKPTSNLTIKSSDFTAEKMKALEDILYGTETEDPRLPLPAEVATLMAA